MISSTEHYDKSFFGFRTMSHLVSRVGEVSLVASIFRGRWDSPDRSLLRVLMLVLGLLLFSVLGCIFTALCAT